jgi:hypothetical protein
MQNFIRTSAFRIICLLALILIGLLALPHAVFAESTVTQGFNCRLAATDSGLPVTLMTTKTHSVISSSGNSTVTCQFTYTGTGLPNKALKVTKFNCGTYVGITTDSKVVISPSGQIKMTCHVKASKGNRLSAASKGAPLGEMSGVVNP